MEEEARERKRRKEMRREEWRSIGNEGDGCQDLLNAMAPVSFLALPLAMTADQDVDYHRCE